MPENHETPEERRERIRQKELRGNPMGNLGDATNRASSGGLVDLVGALGWKGTGILLIILIVGFFTYAIFFH